MKSLVLGACGCIVILHCSAQVREPYRGNMVKEDYMSMLIDSLSRAESDNDTAKIIRFAAVLANEFQTAPMVDRASTYLHIAINHARAYSDPNWFADVCNRAGMLMPSLIDISDNSNYKQMVDSSFYWYRKAVKRALDLKQFQAAGWGYRGMLHNAVHFNTSKSVSDSIPYYYHKAIELATLAEDKKLMINCHTQFVYYLFRVNDWQEIDRILVEQSNRLAQMTPTQKINFYIQLHDYFSVTEGLDTLRTIRELIMETYQYRVAALNKEALYAQDQKYEVSKTKHELEQTVSRLELTSKVLIFSFIALVVFAMLAMVLFYLFRKIKILSRHNEFLLKEQNHRVKNNLQMISSLLSLQSQQLSSRDAQDALNESQSRINSVALLHRMLYEGEHVGQIETTTYLRSLVEEIQYSAARKMEIELDLPDKLELKIEKVTSLGLIVNELLTNSIKHVESHIALRVFIRLIVTKGKHHLTYRDNGRGVVPEEWISSESFGNQLIHIQSRQLKGEFEVSAMDGFKYDLRISV